MSSRQIRCIPDLQINMIVISLITKVHDTNLMHFMFPDFNEKGIFD